MPHCWLLVPLALSFLPVPVAPSFRYPEAKHGKGSLKYINGLPVLTLDGTPEEIGEQEGVLAIKPAPRMLKYPRELLKAHGVEIAWPLIVRTGNVMYPHFPAEYRKELEAAVKA